MYVIGHYDIPSNSDVVLLRLGRKHAKYLVALVSCQEALPFVCIERDEVKRTSVIKQTYESRWPPWPFLLLSRGTGDFVFIITREINLILGEDGCNHGRVSLCRLQ